MTVNYEVVKSNFPSLTVYSGDYPHPTLEGELYTVENVALFSTNSYGTHVILEEITVTETGHIIYAVSVLDATSGSHINDYLFEGNTAKEDALEVFNIKVAKLIEILKERT